MARRTGRRNPLTASLAKLQVGTLDVTEADFVYRDDKYEVTTPYASTTAVTVTLNDDVTLDDLTVIGYPSGGGGAVTRSSYDGTTSTPSGTITWNGASRIEIKMTLSVPGYGQAAVNLLVTKEAQE